MFGKNPQRKREYTDQLAVQELFHTLQGEGPFAGRAAVFLRLAGCHLACHFCDTEFESNIDNVRPWLDVSREIENMLQAHPNTNLLVITGGEPMRQQTGPLVFDLLQKCTDLVVQYETAGNLWDSSLDVVVDDPDMWLRFEIVTSPKTSMVHPRIQSLCSHYKYVITAGEVSELDGLPSLGMQVANKGQERPVWRDCIYRNDTTIWVSPCDAHDPVKNKANMKATVKSALDFGYRLTLQMHKIVKLP